MVAKQELMPYAFLGGKIIPFELATVSIASQSLQYGLTCFGGVRGYHRNGKNRLLRLPDHFQRFQDGIRILGMDLFLEWEQFQAIIAELIHINAPKGDFYIRPVAISTSNALGPTFIGNHFELGIYMMHLGGYFSKSDGLNLEISSWRKFSDAALPTKAKAGGCYLNSALAKSQAIANGYDDALMMDDSGSIVEASVANIFLVRHGRILMPMRGSAMLEGITRRTVVELLSSVGIDVLETTIDRSMVYTSDEFFLTGTAAELAYVASVDGRRITTSGNSGPIFNRLKELFSSVIEGEHPFSSKWIVEF